MGVNKPRREQRKAEALERQKVALVRTVDQQLDRLDADGRRATRERAKIAKRRGAAA